MKRCVIVGGAEIRTYERVRSYFRPDDFFIYCDCGLRHQAGLEREPDLIIGDFDSHEKPETDRETIVLPVKKDDTDTVYAAKEALRRGFDDFLLVGVSGGRMDHTLANLQALGFLARHGARGYLYEEHMVFTALCNGSLTLPARAEGIFSLFCLGAEAQGVSIQGGQYPLDHGALSPFFPLGVSNHFQGQPVHIAVEDGCVLVGWEL